MSTTISKETEIKTGGLQENHLSKSEHSILTHHGYCMDGFVVVDDDDSYCGESEESDDEYEYSDGEDEEEETESKEEKEEHDLDEELDKEDLELIWTYFKDRAGTCNSGRKRKRTLGK